MPIDRVRVFVASSGNEFMIQIADVLTWGFSQAGLEAQMRVDEAPDVRPTHALQVVVAPHEFVPLFLQRAAHLDPARHLRECWLFNVEQPGSPWFEIAWQHGQRALGFFDLNRAGQRELRHRGALAFFTPLGYAPALASAETPPRDIDVLFLGHASPRREAFLSRHAGFFARHETRLVLVPVHAPRRAATSGYVSGVERARLLARSRIVLNVHSSERDYFEVHRAMLALANGCLFVTETTRHSAPLQPGERFLSASLEELPTLCARALTSPDADVAAVGHRFVTTRFTAEYTARSMLEGVATAPPAPSDWRNARRTGEARTAVRARLRSSQAATRSGTATYGDERNAPFAASTSPAVTVVVTLYDYERYIGECLESVERSEPVEGSVELLVVDDRSNDGSREVVREFMTRTDMPVRLLTKLTNTGLADARNLGLAEARGQSVFMLDADNTIYPRCLPLLWAALRRSGAAAAYGIIRSHDGDSGAEVGLLSQFAWSVPDLVRRPYIDAMALFDREVIRRLGGYATDLIDHGWFGWEDYGLWLTVADAGLHVEFVPQIVASYRVHDGSMIGHTNETSEGLALHFRGRFARLVDAHPDLDELFGYPRDAAAPAQTPVLGAASGIGSTSPEAVHALEDRCASLAHEVRALRESASWRVTAPMRAIYRLITGHD